eukprot:scaffold154_cov129-Cylindrotheca_fusiformis.AAC.21
MSTILSTTKRCSSLLIRLSTNTTNSKSHCKELVSRRLMSSKRQRRQQQQQQQQRRPNPQANPPPPPPQRKWPLMLSIMTVPIMFLGWAASDSIFGNRQIGQNERLRQEFLQSSSSSLVDEESTPILSYCVVRRASGVTHCLTSVQLGDVVEVLQEGVGPNRAYNLCRLPADPNEPLSTDIYGWFPTRWLQKLEDYDKMVQEQWERLETQDKS